MGDVYPRFNIAEIRRTLTDVCRQFDRINDRIASRREKLTMVMVDQILLAYDYLNGLLEKDCDLFSPAGMYSMLELNHIVLCGTDVRKRLEYHQHLMETRNRFQKCAVDVRAWYKQRGAKLDPYRKATEFYTIALSMPQMFVEGNHRTENVIVNYLLVTEGCAPFVLDMENAVAYLDLSAEVKYSDRHNLINQISSFPKHRRDIAAVFGKYGDERYLSR